MPTWSPVSWQQFSYYQAANYPCQASLNLAVDQLKLLPPLVTSAEIKDLKKAIALAGKGKAFILQGGDCAESFSDCRADIISNKLKIILQMSLVLAHGLHRPIIKIGRIAGQYAKPRSSAFETINGITLPSYRGDLINCQAFDTQSRLPNPQLMLQGYNSAATTLNYIRALINSGFADWQHSQHWKLNFIKHPALAKQYDAIVASRVDSPLFWQSINTSLPSCTNRSNFYTSHEALHLHYEQALTRRHIDGHWYNYSTHFPWIGMRTAMLAGSHLEFIRGVQNPIGIKIGPAATQEWLRELLKRVNSQREEGKLVLITRLGAKNVANLLPKLIDTVKSTAIPVTWSCDPMHGNTETTSDGIKTRYFNTILSELEQTLSIHQNMASHLGGVHFELTGDDVTECIGGVRGLGAENLKEAYHSLVDPRLNCEQSLEMAMQLSYKFKRY